MQQLQLSIMNFEVLVPVEMKLIGQNEA